jgi:hypothetical protein
MILVKGLLLCVEIILTWFMQMLWNGKMTINKIAQMVFDSFGDTDIVIAIIARSGSYVSNRLDIFERIFAERSLLDELCRRVDDGCEPLISQIDGYFVAASGLSSGFDGIGSTSSPLVGYAIMLLPACSFGQSEHLDFGFDSAHHFIEIILEQFSVIAGLIEQNRQLKDYSETEKTGAELAAFASVN